MHELLLGLLPPPGAGVGELPEEDKLVVDHHGDQAGGAFTVSIWTGGCSSTSEVLRISLILAFLHKENILPLTVASTIQWTLCYFCHASPSWQILQ